MIIKNLQLNQFRNYENLNINFSTGTNIIYGDNAQGKTNILEAIFVASTTKSERGSKDRELINFNSDEAHIRLLISKENLDHKIDMHIKKNGSKGVAIDGTPIRRSSDLYGLVHVISFAPEDLSIIKNGPAERRRFIDMELCQLSKVYIKNLSDYNKALNQRNNLLKQLGQNRDLLSTIDIWNEQLVNFGTKVIDARSKFIEEIKEVVSKKHSIFTKGKENLVIEYKANTSADTFMDSLNKSLERDIYQKTTTVGPHRDDIDFYINGNHVRTYGSQGQQRTAALSLKLAEIELVKDKIKDNPILLLDDVFSELDRNRQNELLKGIENVQTFITCTGLEEFVEMQKKDNSIFHIVGGKVFDA